MGNRLLVGVALFSGGGYSKAWILMRIQASRSDSGCCCYWEWLGRLPRWNSLTGRSRGPARTGCNDRCLLLRLLLLATFRFLPPSTASRGYKLRIGVVPSVLLRRQPRNGCRLPQSVAQVVSSIYRNTAAMRVSHRYAEIKRCILASYLSEGRQVDGLRNTQLPLCQRGCCTWLLQG